jgi:hypothetical protein
LNKRQRLAELRRELLWRKAKASPEFFCENFVYIRVPSQGRQLLKLRDAQRDGLRHWQENRYSLTLKARQIGWSTLVAAYVLWVALTGSDREVILISRTEREAIDLLRKVKYAYNNLPDWLRSRAPKNTADHQQQMRFTNGSSIVSMPSQSNPARGSSAFLIVVDEWAFLDNAEEAWASIEPVADVGGRIIGLSTANGAGNFFHQLWVDSVTGNNSFKTMFHPWSAVPERDEAWYEAKKRDTLPHILAQEYPSNPEEAFLRSGNPVFDVDILQRLRKQARQHKPRQGYLVDA